MGPDPEPALGSGGPGSGPSWAQARCMLACHSPKASMQPRSSSSTVQPLSRSTVPAMAAGVGRLDQAALPEPPTGLGPDPCPERGRVGVCGGAGRGEPLVGRNRAGAGTPPAGQGRSRQQWPLPGLNGLARDGATHQLGNGLAERLPAHPRSHQRAEGLSGDEDAPASVGPLLLTPSPERHLQLPQLGSTPLSLPSLHSLPSPAGVFWEPRA